MRVISFRYFDYWQVKIPENTALFGLSESEEKPMFIGVMSFFQSTGREYSVKTNSWRPDI
jgi:hypothetical protein